MALSSPLAGITERAGAMFGEADGWIIPRHYGDPSLEYQAALTSAVLLDLSSVGKIRLTGGEAPNFLSNLSTNDIVNLPLGAGCETYFCDSRGKTLFQAWVYHIRIEGGAHALWLETNAGRNTALIQHLDRYLISEAAEFEDVTDKYAQMHLAGPDARSILESALADKVPVLQDFQHMERTFGHAASCSIRSRNRLGLPGYDIVCLPGRAEGIWRMLTAAGAKAAGCDMAHTLRVEAGIPIYGDDIDSDRFVMEIGNVLRAVSYTKGCFLGQEPIVMTRDRAGHAPRAFVGVRLGNATVPSGSKLLLGADEVGLITSTTYSRRAAGNIGLAYIRWKHRDPGTKVEALVDDQRIPVEIASLPIVT